MSKHDLSTNISLIYLIKSNQEIIRSIQYRFSFIQALKHWYKAYSRRQGLLNLLNYDDHMLDDMGYTRYDLLTIAKLPLSADAHRVLKRLGEQRKLPRRRR